LNNRPAIPRQHALQSGERTVNNSEICNLRDALVFFGLHFPHGRKHGCHRIVHPDIDWPELTFDGRSCVFDCPRISDIEGKYESTSASQFDLPLRGFQSIHTARNQAKLGAMSAEFPGDSAAQTRRCSSNYDNLILQWSPSVLTDPSTR
jgi:hypothetical protein